jgi:hypothetical protein
MLPAGFWALHSAATLSALGDKARPIACGDVVRRLVSSATLDALGDRLGPALRAGGQYGVAVRSGVEHVAARARAGRECGRWTFTLDGRNAFNELRRAPMLTTAADMMPEAFEYICHLYAGPPPHLLYQLAEGGVRVLPSRRGAQQGDPFGPALYCCGIHNILQRFAATVREAGGTARAQAFIDDVVGSTVALDAAWLDAVRTLVADFIAVGITIVPAKSHVLPPPNHDPTVAELACIRAAGLTPAPEAGVLCVGVPIGPPEFVRAYTAASISRLGCDKLARHLADMKSFTQPALLLATGSLCRRMGYLMRTVDPALALSALKHSDNVCMWAMEHIMALPGAASAAAFFGDSDAVEPDADAAPPPPPMSADHLVLASHQRMQAHMSLRSGGLSVASAAYHSDAAYVASMLVTLPSMLADMAGGGGAEWLDADFAARLPRTPAVRALGESIRQLATQGITRDRLCLILPPSWVEWALDGDGHRDPTLDVLSAHDCPRAPLPREDDGPGPNRDRARAPGAHAQAALSHELNKLRFGELRRSFANLPQVQPLVEPGAETSPETFPQAMARHRSQCGKGAMSWVTARPASVLLTFSPPECRLALRRSLGIEEHFCARCPFPSCRAECVCDARHARRCRAIGYTFVHNRVRDALASRLTAYGVRHVKEDPTPFLSHADRTLRMDIATIAGAFALSGNQRLLTHGALLDVTVGDPLTCLRYNAHARDGVTATRAQDRKVVHYRGQFDSASYNLWPLAVETYGRWGADGEVFIDALATHAVGGPDSASWRAKGAIAHSIRQHLAVALQRAVSAAVMRHTQRRRALGRPGDGDGGGDGDGAVSDAAEASL